MKAFMIFILTSIIMYLFGAFIAGDLNSNNWDGFGKFLLCVFDGVISAMIILCTTKENK